MAKTNYKIKSLVLIPASGESVYDTEIVVNSAGTPINLYPSSGHTFAAETLEKLKSKYPNLQNIAIAYGWFANSLEASEINVSPRVESDVLFDGDSWKVGNHTRSNTLKTTLWGGTPSDKSIKNISFALDSLGYKVSLLPMIFLDISGKPWRGDIKAKDDNAIDYFFESYQKFITHSASLYNWDKFYIGSELVGLTKHPCFIDKLIELAQNVKTLCPKAKVSYAANWSEYHHNDLGYRPLDKLWASEHIDFIGIDAYFPLTDNLSQNEITYNKIKNGWSEGELYDYYYDNGERKSLSADWAIKNIAHWWKSYHYEPNGVKTDWKPKMKPIVFSEYGFPSVDSATNEPYKFVAKSHDSSSLPKNSKGNVDFKAQAMAIAATEDYWSKRCEAYDGLVCERFLYAEDIRPNFMQMPELFSDADDWGCGHFIKVAHLSSDDSDFA